MKIQTNNGPPVDSGMPYQLPRNVDKVIMPEHQIAPRESAITLYPYGEAVRVPFTGSSFRAVHAALFKMWGEFPIHLTRTEDSKILQGMAAGAGEGSAAFDKILECLRKFGAIEIRST